MKQLLTYLIKLIGKLKPSSYKSNNILILSTTAIGDTLWSTPAIQYLKENSDYKITLLTSYRCVSVLDNNPYIDQHLKINSNNILLRIKVILQVLFSRYHTVFNFHTSTRLECYIGYLGNPRRYYGLYPEIKTVELLTDGIYYNEYIKLHKTDMRISLLNRFLNLPYPKKQYYLEMFPGKEDLYHAKKLIKYNSSNRYIFIQPGASQMRKRWNPDNFRSIVSWLSNKGFICIFAGRKSEKELIYKITNNCANIILIGDENSMQRLSCIINLCDFIISNDTGPMHIAEAMNKPIFAFFADSHLDHAKPITSNFTKLYTCKMSEQYMDNPLPEIVIKDIEKYIFSLKK